MNTKVASFVLTTLTLVLTVYVYAFLVIGEPFRNNGQLAIPTTEIDIFLDTIASSLFPGLVVAVYFSRISQRQPRSKPSLPFSLCFISAWLFSAFLIASTYAVNFGNTWSAVEILLELVLFQTCTLPLIALGLLINLFRHWLWRRPPL